ncbi:MAG: hypothetical protein E3J21_24265 [Anaerolineales bacterium]|nr:MAG: hypothetical protein E3J21_24265 [Anaerolineales bacterium]
MDDGRGKDKSKEIAQVLKATEHRQKAAGDEIEHLKEESTQGDAALDDLNSEVQAVADKLGVTLPRPRPDLHAVPKPEPAEKAPLTNWEQVIAESRRTLVVAGQDPDSVDLDSMLDEQTRQRIEQRFDLDLSYNIRLDPYDHCLAGVAGLIGVLIDFLLVRIPKDITYMGEFGQEGSPLTKWLHSLSIPHDNPLAQRFKVSYDKVLSDRVSGMGGRTHRILTPGHDPLVGLVVGTIDIIRGGQTAISKHGEVIITSRLDAPVYNPLLAIIRQLGHLLSDANTKMGLLPPGFSIAQLMQLGAFGPKKRTIADLARWMYLEGYDCRHFLTMSTSFAAVEALLRAYFVIRRALDEEYKADCQVEQDMLGEDKLGRHPRYRKLAFWGHAVATAGNAGKVLIYQGNPLAINYPQWLAFFGYLAANLKLHFASVTDVIIGKARRNALAIERGWEELDTLFAESLAPPFELGML